MKAHRIKAAAMTSPEQGIMHDWIGNYLIDKAAMQACDLLGGRRALDQAANEAKEAAQHQVDVLRGLAVIIAAWFKVLPPFLASGPSTASSIPV